VAVAGDRSVDVFSSSIGNQLLQAVAVDEIHLYVAPCRSGPGHPSSRAFRDMSSSNSSAWSRPRRRPICATASPPC